MRHDEFLSAPSDEENEPSCSLNSLLVLRINASWSGVSFSFCRSNVSCSCVLPCSLSSLCGEHFLVVIFRTLIEGFVSCEILFLEDMLSEDFSVLFGKLCEKLRILSTFC